MISDYFLLFDEGEMLAAPTFEMGLRFRDDLDMVNALEVFEQLSGDFGEYHRQAQETAINKGVPSFLAAFMPKSGGTYLHGRLVSAGAVEIFNHTQSPIDYDRQAYLVAGWLRIFLLGGACCHSHMRPTPWNMRILNSSEVRKLWVHVRDPRQAALSAYWHGQGMGQGSGEKAIERAAMEAEIKAVHQAKIGGTYIFDMPMDEQVREFFDQYSTWIADWQAARSLLSAEILLTTHEEMVADRDGFENKVLAFHGAEHMRGVFHAPVMARDRFRLGEVDEWRTALDKPTRDWMTDRMPEEFVTAFNWER